MYDHMHGSLYAHKRLWPRSLNLRLKLDVVYCHYGTPTMITWAQSRTIANAIRHIDDEVWNGLVTLVTTASNENGCRVWNGKDDMYFGNCSWMFCSFMAKIILPCATGFS